MFSERRNRVGLPHAFEEVTCEIPADQSSPERDRERVLAIAECMALFVKNHWPELDGVVDTVLLQDGSIGRFVEVSHGSPATGTDKLMVVRPLWNLLYSEIAAVAGDGLHSRHAIHASSAPTVGSTALEASQVG